MDGTAWECRAAAGGGRQSKRLPSYEDSHSAKQGDNVTRTKGVREADFSTGAERSSVRDTNTYTDRNTSTLENLQITIPYLRCG